MPVERSSAVINTAAAATDNGGNGERMSNSRRRRLKEKRKQARRTEQQNAPEQNLESQAKGSKDLEDTIEVEYVTPSDEIPQDDPAFEEYAAIFARFQLPPAMASSGTKGAAPSEKKGSAETLAEGKGRDVVKKEDTDEGESGQSEGTAKTAGKNPSERKKDENKKEGSDEEGGDEVLSKKKMKMLNRLSVAELKQLVKRPEVVEWVDVTAADPKLLVSLKGYRNTVPVPVHWSQKRKYLQNKRGIEKAPFELPEFIKDTGIMEMREAIREKEDQQKLKAKTRERVQPKMGKLEIDYQKLHDAFFRFQTKPRMTIHGDMYYEGKEYETHLKQKRPGELSEELVTALNIPPLAPPPWLINMQRYGPPPSYPNLKIPGLNAPIPAGAQWGYHPGGWGKPPVDEFNRPLYGDVFGTSAQVVPQEHVAPVEKTLWGELESEEEEESESESEEGSEENEEVGESTEESAADAHLQEGLATPSGMTSVATGLTTPEHFELRKEVRRPDDEPKQLYQVLQEKETSIKGFMGSQYVYDLEASKGTKRKLGTGTGVEVAFDPSEMEKLDDDAIRARYEAEMEAKKANHEDLSDMVADHASKQAKKRQKVVDAKSKEKKHKDFKF